MAADEVGYALDRNDYLTAKDVMCEQERVLRYPHAFGATEALALGNRVALLAGEYDRGITVQITRESDGMVLFAWSMDDKAPRNYGFAEGKRRAALASGHASPWTQLELLSNGGNPDDLWTNVPEVVPSAGAFPIRVGDAWVATLCVSGLHDGKDHELAVRALEAELGVSVPALGIAIA